MSGRGTFRGLYSTLFDDTDFQRLTPHARLVLLTLRQCAQAGPAVIFRYYPAVLVEQTGLSLDELESALTELEQPAPREPWIYREGVVVWVRNGLRYDPNRTLANAKHREGVERAIQALPRLRIVIKFCDYYQIDKPFEWPPEAMPKPSERDPTSLREKDKGVGGGVGGFQKPSESLPKAFPHPPLDLGPNGDKAREQTAEEVQW